MNNHIDNIGDNACVNQGGVQIINLVGSLKVAPEQIELKAILNNMFVTIVQIVVFFIIAFYPLGLIAIKLGDMRSFYNLAQLIILLILIGMAMFIILSYTDKLMRKIPTLHVVYKDGVLIIDGIDFKFYEDIWDMKYKKNIIVGGSIRVYGLGKKSRLPFSQKINFRKDSEAKYVYDSFWNKDRMSKYLK